MNERIESIRQWVSKRSSREQLYIFICGFGFIYLIFYVFFYHPLSRQKADIAGQTANLEAQKTAIQQQIQMISQTTQDPIFLQMILEHERLQASVSHIQARLQQLKPKIIQPKDTQQMIGDMIKAATNNIEFVKLDELPIVLWLSTPEAKSALAGIVTEELYEHTFQIEFVSDYENTFNYLRRLEQLKWPVYWDSLDYKVSTYPKADVIIKFHVLSIQKS